MPDYRTKPTGYNCLPKEHAKIVDVPFFLKNSLNPIKKTHTTKNKQKKQKHLDLMDF